MLDPGKYSASYLVISLLILRASSAPSKSVELFVRDIVDETESLPIITVYVSPIVRGTASRSLGFNFIE